MCMCVERERDRDRDRQTDRQTEIETEGETDRQTGRHKERQRPRTERGMRGCKMYDNSNATTIHDKHSRTRTQATHRLTIRRKNQADKVKHRRRKERPANSRTQVDPQREAMQDEGLKINKPRLTSSKTGCSGGSLTALRSWELLTS